MSSTSQPELPPPANGRQYTQEELIKYRIWTPGPEPKNVYRKIRYPDQKIIVTPPRGTGE